MKRSHKQIVIFTVDDTIVLPWFFKTFLIENAASVGKIFILAPKGYYGSFRKTVRKALVLYGTMGFVRLTALVMTNKLTSRIAYLLRKPDRVASVMMLSKLYGVPCEVVESAEGDRVQEYLREEKPDAILSVSLPQVLSRSFIERAGCGIYNIHTARLPEYRGVLPVFWALLDGKTSIGATLHKIDPGIDTGGIILQDTFAVTPDDTLESCMKKGKILGAELAGQFVRALGRGPLQTVEGKAEKGGYYSFPKREDVVRFKKMRKIF